MGGGERKIGAAAPARKACQHACLGSMGPVCSADWRPPTSCSPSCCRRTTPLNCWPLRLSCPPLLTAAGLDMLSNHFGDELLPIMLPIVQQRLHDADWRARESGESCVALHCKPWPGIDPDS